MQVTDILRKVKARQNGIEVDKPKTENEKLQKIIDRMWTEGRFKIGDGSIMDAIRHEKKTDTPTQGKMHETKGKQLVVELNKWIRSKTSPKPKSDLKVARMLVKELKDAIKSDPDE